MKAKKKGVCTWQEEVEAEEKKVKKKWKKEKGGDVEEKWKRYMEENEKRGGNKMK